MGKIMIPKISENLLHRPKEQPKKKNPNGKGFEEIFRKELEKNEKN